MDSNSITRHAASPAWLELLFLALAVVIGTASLVLAAVAGPGWLGVGLVAGAAPVVLGWRRGSSASGRHRR